MPFVNYRGANGEWIKLGGGNVRVSNGHNWIPPRARIWTGSEWKNLLEERHVDTWEATASEGYWGPTKGNLAHTYYSSLVRHDRLCQGNYLPYHDSFIGRNGKEGGMFWVDIDNMRNALQGSRIEKVEVYMHVLHSGYRSGTQLTIGTHNTRGWQDRFSQVNYGVASVRYYGQDQGQWITVPTWVGNDLRDGKICGFTTFDNQPDLWHYCYIAGIWDGWKKPKIRITYWK